MTQNELKKELQMNLPEPPEGFDARSEATLAKLMIEEEPQVKKKLSVGLVFAIVLALLSLTAVAATLSGWNIGSFSRFYGDQDVPENFESGFDQDLETELDGVLFHIVDAYATPGRAIVMTEISMKDGSPALFRHLSDPADQTPLGNYLYDLRGTDDPRTVQDYADEKQLPVIPVYVELENPQCNRWQDMLWCVDDTKAIFVSEAFWNPADNEQAIDLDWISYVLPESEEEPDWEAVYASGKRTAITLPVSDLETVTIPVSQEITGPTGPVIVDTLTLKRSSLETRAVISFHADILHSEDPETLTWCSFCAYMPDSLQLVPAVLDKNPPDYSLDPETNRISGIDELSLNLPRDAEAICLHFGQYHPADADSSDELLYIPLSESYESGSAVIHPSQE